MSKETKHDPWMLIAAFMVLVPAGVALNTWGVLCFADWLDVPGVTPWRAFLFVCLHAWLASSNGRSNKSNDGAEKNPIAFTGVVLLARTALLGFFALIVWVVEN